MLEHEEREDCACWCNPEVSQVCPECEESEVAPPDCWRCAGRGVVEPYDDDLPCIVVHRDV